MKALFICLLISLSHGAIAQDPTAYLNNFDQKVYSLKTKGVKDFAVDLENSKLTKQLNDQLIFGKVSKVVFKLYWTANPERLDVVVQGLPDGFIEAKEDLKIRVMALLENLIPLPMVKKFSQFKISAGPKPKEILMQDNSGLAPIPSYVLKFDATDKLTEVVGNKPVGTFVTTYEFGKDSFADGKWVLKETTTTNSENNQSVVSKSELSYGTSQGIGVLTEIEQSIEQTAKPGSKPFTVTESWEFENYRINTGEGLKHFLGEGSKKEE